MNLRQVPKSEAAAVRRMLDRYLGELSAFGEVNFDYPYFDDYWSQPDHRWPYFILAHGSPIGFAFVRRTEVGIFSMAEFYIMPSNRRRGAAIEAAVALIGVRPGRWELSIFERNLPARRFWPKAIVAAGATAIERTDQDGEIVYRFLVPPPDMTA